MLYISLHIVLPILILNFDQDETSDEDFDDSNEVYENVVTDDCINFEIPLPAEICEKKRPSPKNKRTEKD